MATIVATAFVVAKLRSEYFGNGSVFCEIAVTFQFTRFSGCFGGGKRRSGQMLSDPKGNSVSSIPGKDVAFAEDDIFEGVGWKTMLAYDLHSVICGGGRELSCGVGRLDVARGDDGCCHGCCRRSYWSNNASKTMHVYIHSKIRRYLTALLSSSPHISLTNQYAREHVPVAYCAPRPPACSVVRISRVTHIETSRKLNRDSVRLSETFAMKQIEKQYFELVKYLNRWRDKAPLITYIRFEMAGKL